MGRAGSVLFLKVCGGDDLAKVYSLRDAEKLRDRWGAALPQQGFEGSGVKARNGHLFDVAHPTAR